MVIGTLDTTSNIKKMATLSTNKLHRYFLYRGWNFNTDDVENNLLFCMLNPSTADADVDDPTIRKCVGFAKRSGYNSISVVNLFSYRATKPKDLIEALGAGIDISGGHANISTIDEAASNANRLVVAWGGSLPKGFKDYVREITERLAKFNSVWCLGYTNKSQPRHPLMLSYSTEYELYKPKDNN